MMWLYTPGEQPNTWIVGFYHPEGDWIIESTFYSTEEAARRVNYLNGGRGKPYKW